MSFQDEKDKFIKEVLSKINIDDGPRTPGTTLICGDQSHFPDDIKTVCAKCHKPIYHRPHSSGKGTPTCFSCAMIAIRLKPDASHEHTITMRTVQEVVDMLRKKMKDR